MSNPDIKPIRRKWSGTMTDRQRFNAQMHHQPVDRCFNMEFGYWQENFQQWDLFRENGITSNAEADAFFSFDQLAKASGVIWMHPPMEEKVIGETETTRIIRNVDGLTGEVPKDGHSTIPYFTRSSINGPGDWQRIKEERFRRDEPARGIDLDGLRAWITPDRDFAVGVNTGSLIGKVRDMLTLEGLTYAIHDYPDMVEDMVETACLLVEDQLDQLLGEFDFDFASGWEDISCNSGPLVSMAFFRDVLLPRYRRIGDKLEAAGIDIWYTDCDGDVRPFIPGFLEAGLNTMFPWEVNGSGHPGEALDEFGPDLRILGGMDKMVLARGRGEIREYLRSLQPYVERGGFIPFCDHRCPPNVDPEDYLYYLDLKQDLLGMEGGA